MDQSVRFQVLGMLRAWRSGEELDLGPPQQRAVAAALILRAGVTVSPERLIDDVWGEDPPRTAPMALRNYIYRLRRSAAAGRCAFIQSGRSGYTLAGGGAGMDLAVFEQLVARARALRLGDDVDGAYAHYAEGLALWSGHPLAGVPGPYAKVQRTRLGELRLTAFEEYVECALRLGRYAQALAELPGMVLEHPFDERLRELHMLALHGAGRQADALAVYRDIRRVLNEQLGAEPGVGLREAHRRVLAGEQSPPPRPGPKIAVRGSAEGADDEGAAPAGSPAAAATPAADPVGASAAAFEASGAAAVGWSAGVRLAQLPPRVEHLVGRARELDALMGRTAYPDKPMATVSVVHGMPGIGKTTLAVACAHLLAPDFPDGQLYIDLRGFDPRVAPTSPSQALADLLASMGVAEGLVPASLSARAALFRSMLAGRRMLLVLDNARDAEQVRPLLPGEPGCRTLITSRNAMCGLIAGYGAQSVPLAVFRAEEAAEFLTAALGPRRLRIEKKAGIADLVVEGCAGLPLALAIVAARLAADTPACRGGVAQALAADGPCLDAFVLGGDAAMDARAVFSSSYQVLSVRAARVFRVLSKYRDRELTALAASSLVELTPRETRDALGELASVHLASARSGGRYVIHSLLRAYGMELSAKYDREAW